ncbi:hypothetical protein ACLQ3C_04010 [Gordonia sp. DT30]
MSLETKACGDMGIPAGGRERDLEVMAASTSDFGSTGCARIMGT